MEASRSMEIDGAGESVPMEDNQPSTSGSEKPTVIIVIGTHTSPKLAARDHRVPSDVGCNGEGCFA